MSESARGGTARMASHILPFFWQHGEAAAILREEIDRIEGAGMRELCVESRPHPDFLGELWWRDMDLIMDECRKRGMGVWLLDDERFPSGYAADAVRKRYPDRGKLFLREKHADLVGPKEGTSLLTCLKPGERLVAAVAGERAWRGEGIRGETIDISAGAVGDVVYWDIPEGIWRVHFLYTSRESGHEYLDRYVDPLTPGGALAHIETVYEPHYGRYASDFGSTFLGFFADEPQFGNAVGYDVKLGTRPFMPLPWREGLERDIELALGEDDARSLPGLWYDIGDRSYPARFAYMDIITRAYSESYAGQIGDWCRERGVSYIGHVIEENNAHARLGGGMGHYYRSLWGQDMSGIDVVLHEIIPGMKGISHAWTAREYDADSDFFYYCLAKLASSLAHADPKKKGRALCEIFGAYGWQESMAQMRWMTDFMIVRGINYFVPHAFSPAAFPDPDCPPHFYARGRNPHYRFFGLLMGYMERLCDLFDGGIHVASAAVLYHGEAEWSSARLMLCQEPMRALMEEQIDADILSIDILLDAGTTVAKGSLLRNGEAYGALVVPYAEALPESFLAFALGASEAGLPVLFVDDLPARSSEGRRLSPEEASRLGEIVSLPRLASRMRELGLEDIRCRDRCPDLRSYHYRKGGVDRYLFFNESIGESLSTEITFQDGREPSAYEPETEGRYRCAARREETRCATKLELGPSKTLVISFGEATERLPGPPEEEEWKERRVVDGDWRISFATALDYPRFVLDPDLRSIGNLNRPGGRPRFSGTVRYEIEIEIDGAASEACLDAGEVGEIAQAWLDGVDLGVRYALPYRWRLPRPLKTGRIALTIEVTNSLVYEQHDWLSFFQPIQASGLVGPVELLLSGPEAEDDAAR